MPQTPLMNKAAASIVREEDLEDMREIMRDLQERLNRASDDGRVYLMSHLIRAIAMFKSETERLERRFNREMLAQHRKAEKELRQQLRQGATADDTETAG